MALKTYLDKKLKERSLLLMTHAVVGYPSLEDNWEMLNCMQEAGVDLLEVQKILGHRSLLTTSRYTHLTDGTNRNAGQLINALMNGFSIEWGQVK